MNKKRVVLLTIEVMCVVLAITCFVCANRVDNSQKKQYSDTYKAYVSLFSSDSKSIPRDNLKISEITYVEKMNKKVVYEDKRKKLSGKLNELKNYVVLKNIVDGSFNGDVLNSNVTSSDLESIQSKSSLLPKKYQNLLSSKIKLMNDQFGQINDVKNTVNSLFVDDQHQQVRDDVTRDMYNAALSKNQLLKQQDVSSEQQSYLEIVNSFLSQKEEEERRKIAEEKRRQSEEKRRQEEERKRQIQAAWTILEVPYISQNGNNVLNGCEVDSLLMGLKYKGYLKDMDLVTYAENVPKSTDPFSGFTYDIYGIQPNNVPHWIAPEPLAQYGRTSSGNNGVVDGTGRSLDELDAQIKAGNPVVIYLTAGLKAPKEFVEGAPKNLHVLLLTGYNSITGEQIITDPWTYSNGKTKWNVSKKQVESIYNATGKRSVIIS